MDKRLVLIGCGKAGLSLALALKGVGWEVAGCASRTEQSTQRGMQWLACPRITSAAGIPEDAVIILGVPEASLSEVDRRLAREDPYLDQRVILHVSGAVPSRVLEACRLRGASVGSLHPMMAMPDPITGAKLLRQATFAIEGRPAAVEVMKGIAQALSGHFFTLSPRGKAIYHAAGVVASNHLVALLAESHELLELSGADMSVAGPAFQALVEGTVQNFYSQGPVAALTGPIERGDMETVQDHLRALRKLPKVRDRYRAMAMKVLELARKRHPHRKELYDTLENLLTGWHSS